MNAIDNILFLKTFWDKSSNYILFLFRKLSRCIYILMIHSQMIVDNSQMTIVRKDLFCISTFWPPLIGAFWKHENDRIYKIYNYKIENAEAGNLWNFFMVATSHITVTICLRAASWLNANFDTWPQIRTALNVYLKK